MRVRMQYWVLLSSIVAISAGCARNTPEQAAEAFYGPMLRDGHGGGTVWGDEIERLKPLMSDSLRAAFENAVAYTDTEQKRRPCDKPAYGDGFPVVSKSADGFSAFSIVQKNIDKGNAFVEVNFTRFDGQGNTRPFQWADFLQLVKQDRRWKVDDVIFAGDFPTSLKAELAGLAIAQLPAAYTCPSLDKLPVEIGQWLDVRVQQLRKQHKNPEIAENVAARKLVCGQLTGDEATELTLLFTVEGVPAGNNWEQHVVVFSADIDKAPVFVMSGPVGGKEKTTIDDISIGCTLEITLAGKTYQEGDASCCPSKPYHADMAIEEHGFKVRAPQSMNQDLR